MKLALRHIRHGLRICTFTALLALGPRHDGLGQAGFVLGGQQGPPLRMRLQVFGHAPHIRGDHGQAGTPGFQQHAGQVFVAAKQHKPIGGLHRLRHFS